MIETSRANVMEALRNASIPRSTGGIMIEESLAHTTWDCTYHIVWIPKYRRKVLYGECRKEVIEVVRQLLANKKIQIVEGAICSDHIHLSIRIPQLAPWPL